ncbi:Endonuclease/Exonuclease/phosphatase family protein [Poseidonocella pacifica]|uniref:Endonuclease/Exonuclease/phosphatase family protein n=1 Tax=Poseidonocella pacifica TaxID=871651 RepID=A0A1I0XAH3_9RHOB|nr:endonuclease/exonuclease/phosphatase family protein [Poseidonocella pacifica]SFA97894.1 Endonuclease/Exonuclease/phosphatase family protein [Poseidonocella pacifica]
MRIATYNVEWFTNLFDDAGQMLADDGPSGRRGISRRDQLEALATVFRALDADAVLIIEAPDENRRRSSVAALEQFAEAAGLRTRRALIGFANTTQQEIALLFDPDRLTARHDPVDGGQAAPRFDLAFDIDLDIDDRHDRITFSKPPLEVALETAGGSKLRLIGAHLKSKAPHGAHTPEEISSRAIANRRKQLAQAVWLRRRVDGHLTAGDALIVAGDLNDGPGLDEYEALFGRSSFEIVLGAGGATRLRDPNAEAVLSNPLGAHPTTARFFVEYEKRFLLALLDYVMLSPDLAARGAAWRTWHPFEDAECWGDADLRAALLVASDHFPVSVDVKID